MGKYEEWRPRCRAVPVHCSQLLATESFLAVVISDWSDAPTRSSRNSIPSLLMAPIVSATIAINKCACVNGTVFLSASVTPSCRLPSVLSRPDCFLTAGMSAFDIARHTRSLKLWCLADRPLPPLHDSPCSPLASTVAPQGHW